MKVNILFEIKETPLGGGNQFLKLLKKQFIENGLYAELEESDAVIFNSYQYLREVVVAKRKYPDKVFIHRIDGPIRLYNHMEDKRDLITNMINRYIADGTVFQSEWSRKENYRLGLKESQNETIIYNCADPNIFYCDKSQKLKKNKKIKIIATSWSNNKKKGFAVYQYLDDNLDWDKYEMTFVGNSPVEFKNIRHISPLSSVELAKILNESDIYISASQKDPCSNSLIEALSCGLPVICYKDGGHPELVKDAGELFEHQEEIPALLEKVVSQYGKYVNNIEVEKASIIMKQYYDFICEVNQKRNNNEYKFKRLSFIQALYCRAKIKYWSK